MRAKRENKVYTIKDEQEKNRYLKDGYDIYDDEGNLLEYSPLKKIAYSEYVKVLEENKILKEKVAELTASAEAEKKTTKKV